MDLEYDELCHSCCSALKIRWPGSKTARARGLQAVSRNFDLREEIGDYVEHLDR